MTDFRAEQANFSYGQLDPRMAARTDFEGYYKGAQNLNNCIVIPQGGFQKRFGTDFVGTTINELDKRFINITTLTTSDGAIYLLVFEALILRIFLQNTFPSAAAQIVTTYLQADVRALNFTQVNDRLIIVHPFYPPAQLQRTAEAPILINGFSAANSTLTINSVGVYNPGAVLPVQFTTGGALPTTVPQIALNKTYFAKFITASIIQIYSTADDAGNGINFYSIANAGAASNVNFLNNWAIANIAFINEPAYDFGLMNYAAINFTPSNVSGGITITASAPTFTVAMVGGIFAGNGGIMRLTGFNSNVQMQGPTIVAFNNTNAIPGNVSFLGEPAWSATRFYPQTASFIQNRLVFGGSPSIPNGTWLSTPNEVFNFDDSELLPDNAISWYPSSNQGGTIVNLTAASSLIVHTSTGNYSSPVFTEQPLTPTNFVLTENNKDGVSNVKPAFIDNQIIYVDKSGNNIKNMIWEFSQSKYVLNNNSVPSSNLIKLPVDMAAFTDPTVADGYFVIVVNGDGTLAILQTLKAENVRAWTPANTQYSTNNLTYTTEKIFAIASALNWCWIGVERFEQAINTTTAITGFSAVNNTFHAVGHNIPLNTPSLVTITNAGVEPTTIPQIDNITFYYAVATTANDFQIYLNFSDATNLINVIQIVNAGVTASVNYYVNNRFLSFESLDFNIYTDMTFFYANLASNTVTGLGDIAGKFVTGIADGYRIPPTQVKPNGTLILQQVSNTVTVGQAYTSTFSPLPYANLPNGIGLYTPKHIKGFYINYYLSLGIQIQGYDVPATSLNNVIPGNLPVPVSGYYLFGMAETWDPLTYTISITNSIPFPMTILGIGYVLEV